MSTKAVGWWEDLYRAPENDPIKDQFLERHFFQPLDDRMARLLEKLNAPDVPKLSSDEISVWSTFIMSLLHRTPEGMEAYKETGRRIWDQTVPNVRERYQELRGQNDPETVEEYEASLTIEDADRSLMRNLVHIIANPRLGRFLNQLHWLILDRTPDAPELLLSDDPIARTNGFKKPDGHLALPVSPNRLIVGVYEQDFVQEVLRMRRVDLIKSMNVQTVEAARHFVVATDRSQRRFIENRFGRTPRPGISRSSADHAFDIPDED